jgi:voltage-gated potassium channel
MMTGLKSMIDDGSTKAGRIFDFAIQGLIVLSLVTFSIETLPDLPVSAYLFLHWVEVVTVVLFTAEYMLRIAAAENRRDFIFSFYGLVDLLAILPFYLAGGIDLRSIRALRLLRLFRAFKLVRYSMAIRRFHRAFLRAKEELILSLVVAAILVFFSAAGIYYFERASQPEKFKSVFHSLWWAITSLTTVGYGDAYPVTTGGKIFTTFVLIIGLGIVAVPTGLVASALSKARELEDLEKRESDLS